MARRGIPRLWEFVAVPAWCPYAMIFVINMANDVSITIVDRSLFDVSVAVKMMVL